ncbi:hypothetical protein [Oceaniradius stylonematis]|uniref:hypothetical protein n=1 Tax=Oceaniradius stylonematis TaxID=2184161 RepID=UPI00273F94A9|nr:hypothetical protein [Oceaniradius stylonematis]
MPADNGYFGGTIFHVGETVGAGFAYANNTTRTSNPRVVTFHVKGADGVTVTDLGKPYGDETAFGLVVINGELVADAYSPGAVPRRYDNASGKWRDVAHPGSGVPVDFIVIDGKMLWLYPAGTNLFYDRSAITGDPRWAGKQPYQVTYLHEKLYVHVDGGGASDYTYVCEWAPGRDAVSNCVEIPFNREAWPYTRFPASSGIGIADSSGNVKHLYDGTHQFDVLRAADHESWQVYSSLLYDDTLWMGHFPSGNLIEWSRLAPMSPAIGKQPASDAYGREAQSLGIHMGEIVVGMWPFGEIWSGKPGDEFALLTRVFPYPAVASGTEPFTAEALAAGQPYNALGQRIFGIANWREGIAVAATMKHPNHAVALNQLSEAERAPYGSVFLIQQDYELSCEIRGSGQMELAFVVTTTEMQIKKDGAVLCSQPIASSSLASLGGPITIGAGPWGGINGTISGVTIER